MADICERIPRVLRRPVHSTLERLEQAAERSAHYIRALHNRCPAVDIQPEKSPVSTEVGKVLEAVEIQPKENLETVLVAEVPLIDAVSIEPEEILDPTEVEKAKLIDDAVDRAEALHEAVMDRLPQINEHFNQVPNNTDYRELIKRRRNERG